MTREWYMHPNGQSAAYEWTLGDVNPPVHAWPHGALYKIEHKRRGKPTAPFWSGSFHKLLLNFTWWVESQRCQGRNVFQGGFLGWITSASSIAALPCPARIYRTGRRHRLDGHVLPQPAGHRALELRTWIRRTKT